MGQSQTGFEMQGLDGKKGFIVGFRLIVVLLALMDERTKIEGCKILLVSAKDTAIFCQGIVPALQLDISLRLPQTEVDIVGVILKGRSECLQRVTPFLHRLGCNRMND